MKNTKRVLDITQGSLCYVVGTIYMEMRLKPNILEELAREVCPREQRGLRKRADTDAPSRSNTFKHLRLSQNFCRTTMKSCWKTSPGV